MKKPKEANSDFYLKLLVKTSVFVLISGVISRLFGYGYKLIIARHFNPEIYGLFSLSTVVLGIVSAIFSLGFSAALVRFIPFYLGKKRKGNINLLVKFSLMIISISGILAGFVLFFTSDFLAAHLFNEPQLRIFIIMVAIAMPFVLVSEIFLAIIRSFEKIKTYSFLSVQFLSGAKFILLLALVLLGIKINAIVFSYILSYVLLLFLSFIFSKKIISSIFTYPLPKEKEAKKIRKEFLNYSWPLIFTGIIFTLYFWIDSLVIGYLGNATQVGYYNVAITFVSVALISPELFLHLFNPLISKKLAEGQYETIREITKQVTKWILLINLPLFMLLAIFPGVFINLFFGSTYLPAESALRILAFGCLFSGFINIFANLISIKGDTKITLRNFIIFAAINFFLSIILYPRYGIEGVAFATALSWIFFTSTLVFQIKKQYFFYPLRKDVFRVVVAGILSLLFMLFLKVTLTPTIPHLILSACLFIVAYLIFLLLTRSFDKNDNMIIQVFKAKISTKYQATASKSPLKKLRKNTKVLDSPSFDKNPSA